MGARRAAGQKEDLFLQDPGAGDELEGGEAGGGPGGGRHDQLRARVEQPADEFGEEFGEAEVVADGEAVTPNSVGTVTMSPPPITVASPVSKPYRWILR
nr:hypothetical protein [Streptomyces sp. PanSC9]